MSAPDIDDLRQLNRALATAWEISQVAKTEQRSAAGYRDATEKMNIIQDGIRAFRRIAGLPPSEKIRTEL